MMKTELRKDNMLTLVGEGVSPGLAKGQAFIYIDVLKRESEFYKIDDAQVDEEKARIDKAIDDVRQSLTIDVKRIESQLGLIPLLLRNSKGHWKQSGSMPSR
jgi:phosphotransferase system enzyme I (PtsI)